MRQVLGGHGYIRENGMEQIVRDTRIATLYEGTTGIQVGILQPQRLDNLSPSCPTSRFGVDISLAASLPTLPGCTLIRAFSCDIEPCLSNADLCAALSINHP